MAVLYVETNYPVAIATGRDPKSDFILDGGVPSLGSVIPGICFMEALVWLDSEVKGRKKFDVVLRDQIKELPRDLSGETQTIVSHLEQARVDNERLWKVIGNRLFLTIERLSDRAEILPVTAAILKASRKEVLVSKDSTDNLIAHVVLDHARSATDPDKALLTENHSEFDQPEIRAALKTAGVIYFSSSDRVIDWAKSRPGVAEPTDGPAPGI